MISIPSQLSNERFIVLSARGKTPVQQWSQAKYQYTATGIRPWLEDGWNYAVIYTSDLCVFDADSAARLMELGIIQDLPKTFTVMSGREGLGLHLYYRLSDPPAGSKIYLYDTDGSELGDIRLPHSKFYNVGPNCIHPSGRPYQIVSDLPITTVRWDDLEGILGRVTTKIAGVQTSLEWKPREHQQGTLDEYNLSVLDFLMPEGAKLRGDEIEGTHPIHGSTTGSNLTVKKDGSVWWCRRCGSGGNWIDALAVAERIIDCSDSYPGRKYSKEEWKQIDAVLQKLKPDVHDRLTKQWWMTRNASKLSSIENSLSRIYAKRRGGKVET